MEFGYSFKVTEVEGEFLVSFPDVPEAITGGATEEEAKSLAHDALLAALGGYIEDKREIPVPTPQNKHLETAYLRPLEAAKLALYIALRQEGLSNVGLAKRLCIDEKEVRRMLDLDHGTKIESINRALEVISSKGRGYQLITFLQSPNHPHQFMPLQPVAEGSEKGSVVTEGTKELLW
jgi:antitoxin HicB